MMRLLSSSRSGTGMMHDSLPRGDTGACGMATCWRRDETLKVFDLVRRVCREQSAGCEEMRLASRHRKRDDGISGGTSSPRR